jgi:hypothetical protein
MLAPFAGAVVKATVVAFANVNAVVVVPFIEALTSSWLIYSNVNE